MAIKEVTPTAGSRNPHQRYQRRLHRCAHRSRVRQWSSGRRGKYSGGVPRPVARHDDEPGLCQSRPSKLPSRQADIVGCQAGPRSNAAAGLLQQAGYQDVSNMLGGFGGMRDRWAP